MSGITFQQLEVRLEPSALELFDRLAELHVAAPPGAMRQFGWAHSMSVSGLNFQHVNWLGSGKKGSGTVPNVDGVDMQELASIGLIVRGQGKNMYRIPNDGIRFYKWRRQHATPEAPAQVDARIRSVLLDPNEIGKRHPLAAAQLRTALDRIWDIELDDQSVIEVGTALHGAMAAMAADLIGYEFGNPEAVGKVLRPWLIEPVRLPPRQGEALADQIESAVRCCHRLAHLHDERSKGEPEPTWDEARRAAFLATVCCYELDRLGTR